MTLNIKYLTNAQGERTDVLISLQEWQAFEYEYQQTLARLSAKTSAATMPSSAAEDTVNPLLAAIVAENFAEYAAVFQKLA